MNYTSYIKVKEEVIGFHRWQDCPLLDVIFLQEKHRHKFVITVVIGPLVHDNRAVEFFMVQRDIRKVVDFLYDKNEFNEVDFGGKSCEMIAKDIARQLSEKFKIKSVEVSEDGENSAILNIEEGE